MSVFLGACDSCGSEVEILDEEGIWLELPGTVQFECDLCGHLSEQQVEPRVVQHLLCCGVAVDVG